MRFRGGEFSTGTMGNFQPELTAQQILPTLGTIVPLCLPYPPCAGTRDKASAGLWSTSVS